MIIFTLFSVCLLVQVVYLGLLAVGFGRAHRAAPMQTVRPDVPVSVVVAARNEAENLPELISSLSAQSHPRFEVIIADDGSSDSTADLVGRKSDTDTRFRLVTVTPVAPRKKNALRSGISHASNDRIAFTDADCQPRPGWLSSIAGASEQPDAVLVGYSPFRRARGSVNRVASYETFVTGFLTAAAIGLGRPYMAVGRNLSYSKSTFDVVRGFEHSIQSLSGDDDLLVQEASRRGIPVLHLFGTDSFVPTNAPRSWREWLRQKRRHASAGRYYNPSIKGHLLAFHSTAHALWLAPFLAGVPGALLLLARLIVLWMVLRRPAADLDERHLLPGLPVWELIYALYNVLIAPAGVLFGPRAWKTGSERTSEVSS